MKKVKYFMSNIYDLAMILHPSMQKEKVEEYDNCIKEKFASDVEIMKKEYFGLKQFAYEVKGKKQGHYLFLDVKLANNEVLKSLKKFLNNEQVIRHMLIKNK